MTNRLNTINDTAARLSCSRASLYRLIQHGLIRTVKIGRKQLVPDSEIDRFIAASMDTLHEVQQP